MNCCQTPFNICEPLPQCTDSIIVFVPLGYAEDAIMIEIVNGQGIGEMLDLDVINNQVEIDVADFPDGFFNSYSGVFTLKFFQSNLSSELLEFTAIDGKIYNSATFTIKKVSSTTGVIDLFGYEDPGYYWSGFSFCFFSIIHFGFCETALFLTGLFLLLKLIVDLWNEKHIPLFRH